MGTREQASDRNASGPVPREGWAEQLRAMPENVKINRWIRGMPRLGTRPSGVGTMTIVRGYSREGRRLTAAVSLSLSVLFVLVTSMRGTAREVAAAAGLGVFALVLFTPLWYVFYPVLFLALGTSLLAGGLSEHRWDMIASGLLGIGMGLVTWFRVARERRTNIDG